MLIEFLIFVFFLVLYDFVWFQKRPKSFPPGPFRWPIVGNLIHVGLEPYKTVLKMKKKYGDIVGLYMGPKRAVFINEYGLAKEAFNLPALCGRPDFLHAAAQESGMFRGILATSGKVWIEQRRFAFSYIQSGLRNGVPIEELILNEANELIEFLKKNCGRSISTENVFNIPTLNSLWNIITGEKYSVTDEIFLKVIEHINGFMSAAATQGVFFYFPKWSKMFPRLSGYTYVMANVNPVLEFMQEVIKRHKETYEEGIQRDFIDCYLQKIRSTTDTTSSFFRNNGEENLKLCLFDLLVGGSETVANTLMFLVYLMSYHPEVQEKLSNNIKKHLGPGQLPALKDRQMLPFVEAVIAEVLRFSSITPLGGVHKATEDVQFHGYLIPKGTMVIANQYGIAHDPNIWGDPEKFRPERFLNDDETELLEHLAIIPFSIGRRVCPGESLARNELFLFTIRLFQSFKVEFDPNEELPVLGYVNGLTLSPVAHKVIFSRRFID